MAHHKEPLSSKAGPLISGFSASDTKIRRKSARSPEIRIKYPYKFFHVRVFKTTYNLYSTRLNQITFAFLKYISPPCCAVRLLTQNKFIDMEKIFRYIASVELDG
jgi:hypothetical protein